MLFWKSMPTPKPKANSVGCTVIIILLLLCTIILLNNNTTTTTMYYSTKNGSLVRERVRDECSSGSWIMFDEILKQAVPSDTSPIGNYQL